MSEKMTAKGAKEAAKMGVDTSGSLACAHVLQEGLASSVVVVWPDRVEVHSKGRAASITGQGAGVQSMPFFEETDEAARQPVDASRFLN